MFINSLEYRITLALQNYAIVCGVDENILSIGCYKRDVQGIRVSREPNSPRLCDVEIHRSDRPTSLQVNGNFILILF